MFIEIIRESGLRVLTNFNITITEMSDGSFVVHGTDLLDLGDIKDDYYEIRSKLIKAGLLKP
jgi:hypothetical protein